MAEELTPNGLRIYATVTDLDGRGVEVMESSLAWPVACRVLIDGAGLHLDEAATTRLRDGLTAWLEDDHG